MAVSRLPGRRCTAHQTPELPLHLANTDPCHPRRPPGPAGSQRRSPLSCCFACPVVPFCPPSTDTGTSLISRLSPTGVCHGRLLNSLISSASVCRQPRRRHQLLSGSSIDSDTRPVSHYFEAIEQDSFHQPPFSSTQRPLTSKHAPLRVTFTPYCRCRSYHSHCRQFAEYCWNTILSSFELPTGDD